MGEERDVDRYGRIVGRCLVGGLDVNKWLVA
jgi:endonuclease YncB( thermonuclease family)